MVNNICKTTKTLATELGRTTSFEVGDNKQCITGELSQGCLIFDTTGTIGIVSSFTDEDDFIVTTYALSIDITTILGRSY